uniref:Uncharacterized protein n=1 Tax=Ananas comosus var. bracteatus TaxID=296719 RepID=A0A6V7Q6A0_ANACO|nr:unnamed protein product [Ananas comosus var. bracteatus]
MLLSLTLSPFFSRCLYRFSGILSLSQQTLTSPRVNTPSGAFNAAAGTSLPRSRELPSSPPYPVAVRPYLPKMWAFNAATSPARAFSPPIRLYLPPEIWAFNVAARPARASSPPVRLALPEIPEMVRLYLPQISAINVALTVRRSALACSLSILALPWLCSDSQVPGDVRLISLARHPDPGSAETHLTLPAGNWL